MELSSSFRAGVQLAAATAALAFASACQPRDHYVIAATGTVIGVDLSINPATQTPQGKLGYHRGELAIVPTNRGSCVVARDGGQINCHNGQGSGAKDSAEVLMELHYNDIFSSKSSIYQRLAVGTNAVTSQGAAHLFSRDVDGRAGSLVVSRAASDANSARIRAFIRPGGKRDAAAEKKVLDWMRANSVSMPLAFLIDDADHAATRERMVKEIPVP